MLDFININTVIGASIVALPLFIRICSVDTNRLSKDILFSSIAMLIISMSKRSIKKIPNELIVPSIYIMLTIMFNQHDPLSLNSLIHTICLSSGWFMFVSLCLSWDMIDKKVIYNGIMIGSIVQSIIGIFGFFNIEIYFGIIKLFRNVVLTSEATGSLNVIGSFGNNNLLASYLCISVPFFFSKKDTAILSVIPIVAILLSKSQMGLMSLVAGLVYYINNRFCILSKIKIYILTSLSMVIIPFFDIGIDSGRFELWRKILSTASVKHYVFGMGLGWFPDMNITVSSTGSALLLQEHNSYLSLFNSFGLIGLLLMFPIFVMLLKQKNDDLVISSAMFIVFCNSWGHFTVQQSTVMIIIIPIISIVLGKALAERDCLE